MQLRHRIPTIFSIYMVDVLCCALGCVVLLWQVNVYEADVQTQAAQTHLRDLLNVTGEKKSLKEYLDQVKSRLDDSTVELDAERREKAKQQQLALLHKGHLDEAELALAEKNALIAGLGDQYDALLKSSKEIKTKLTAESSERAKQEKLVLATRGQLDEAQRALIEKTALMANLGEAYEKLARLNAETEKTLEEKKKDLADSTKRELRITVELDAATKEKSKQQQLALVYKSHLDEAQKALAEKLMLLAALGDDYDKSVRAAAESLKKLEESKKNEKNIAGDLDEARKERAKQQQLALVLRSQYDEYKSKYDFAQRALAERQKLLDALGDEYDQLLKSSKADSTEKARLVKDLSDREVILRLKLAVLEKEARDADDKLQTHTRSAREKELSLKDAEARIRDIEAKLEAVQLQGKNFQTKLSDSTAQSRLLEDDLSRTRKLLDDETNRFKALTRAHDVLSDRVSISNKELDRYKSLALQLQSRFAGMTLTGNKVIFLVDMSGSMEMVDPKTLAPDKWPLVCDTLGQIMQSLPNLKQYQVIMFSDKVVYPLGRKGQWLDFKSAADVRATVAAVRKVKPDEGTNMSLAFAEVFRYREQGLDTVYFFSDGLPNLGEGLPNNAFKLEKMEERERNEVCSKYIRDHLKSDWNRPLANQPRVRINTIGFFFESPEVGAFLWALAREHDGSFVGMSKP